MYCPFCMQDTAGQHQQHCPNREGIKYNFIPDTNKQPYICPVCKGNGLVSEGFYNQTSGEWTSVNINFETCRTCNGTGIVWN